jgi:predicted GTPase
MGRGLPALGYGAAQLEELAATIRRVDCDTVLLGTPAPLEGLITIRQDVARAGFHAADVDEESLERAVLELLRL